jgi:hypothetical protein
MIRHGDFYDFDSDNDSIKTYMVIITGDMSTIAIGRFENTELHLVQRFPTISDLSTYITKSKARRNESLSPPINNCNIELTGDDCRFLLGAITSRGHLIPGPFAVRSSQLLSLLLEISNVQPPQQQPGI